MAEAVFAYSDVPHAHVMAVAWRLLACGADFTLRGPVRTMLQAPVPGFAVSAVRTGCGKSPTSRWIARRLLPAGLRLRHPMPYGDLSPGRRCFRNREDPAAQDCTVEEREEYEPYLALGVPVYAGVDYGRIAAETARECDVILWDGGNNDSPFFRPDLHLVLVDALRTHDVTGYLTR